MTTPVGAPNYQQLQKLLVGRETRRGGGATMTNKWYGKLALTRRRPLADSDEWAGTWFQDYTPVRGAVIVEGTYNQQLAYEDAHLFSYAVAGASAVPPTDDGNTTHGYTYPFRPTPARDDLDTFAAEYGDPQMIWSCLGLMFPEFTLSADIDDAQGVWKFASRVIGIDKDLKAMLKDVAATGGTSTTFVKTGWGQTIDALIGRWAHFKTGTAGNIDFFREILDNDATSLTFAALAASVQSGDTIDVYPGFTSGISDRTRETIKGPGTILKLAGSQVAGRFISFSMTSPANIAYARYMENVDTMSSQVDRGMVRVTGQVRLKFDRRREWENWKNAQAETMQIIQTGSTIDSGASTKKGITVDVYNLQWDDPTEDVRGNTITVTMPFRGYVDTGEGVHYQVAITNKQSALLA